MTSSQAGPPTGTAPDVSQEKETLFARAGNAIKAGCYNVGLGVGALVVIGIVFSSFDNGKMARAMWSGTGTFLASVANSDTKKADDKKVGDTFSLVNSANAQDKKPAPAPAASGTKLDQEAAKIVFDGKPSVVAVPGEAMEPKKFLGNMSLYSTDEIRKSIDWLKDRVTVALRALEQALHGLVWVMNEQYKDAFDIKFFQDVEKKLSDMIETWQSAMTKRWGEGVTLASKDRNDNDLKKMQVEVAANKAKISAIEGELTEAKETLGGLFVGVPMIDAVVEIDHLNRKVVNVYDAKTGSTLLDVVYFNGHFNKKGSHWSLQKLAFVTWAQAPGQSAMHYVVWKFNLGYRPGVACAHAPLNRCMRIFASDPASGYYDAKGAASELVREGFTKAESSALMDQRKKHVKE